MLKHIVLWTFPEQADGHTRAENMERVREVLMRLPPIIPEIRRFELHADAGIDPNASTMCLISEFEDAAALQRYAVHPDHKAASALISRVRSDRAVIDYTF
jgi:quinol monooxygenase YgiN